MDPNLTSGTAAISTTDDNPVTLIANTGKLIASVVNVINEGAIPGFVSVDGGNSWARMPATSTRTFNVQHLPFGPVVKAKRVSGGANMTDLYADAY